MINYHSEIDNNNFRNSLMTLSQNLYNFFKVFVITFSQKLINLSKKFKKCFIFLKYPVV